MIIVITGSILFSESLAGEEKSGKLDATLDFNANGFKFGRALYDKKYYPEYQEYFWV